MVDSVSYHVVAFPECAHGWQCGPFGANGAEDAENHVAQEEEVAAGGHPS